MTPSDLEGVFQRVREWRSNGTPILSLSLDRVSDIYLPRAIPARIKDLLRQVEPSQADHAWTMGWRRNVERVHELMPRLNDDIGHGVALFVNGAERWEEYISVPRPLRETAFCGPLAALRPLHEVVAGSYSIGVVVIDPRIAHLYRYALNTINEEASLDGEEIRKRDRGGWFGLDEYTNRNRAEQVVHHHFRAAAALLANLVETHQLQLIAIGGHHQTIEEFRNLLDPALALRVAGTFIVDLHTLTTAAVKDHCVSIEDAWRRVRQRELAQSLAAAPPEQIALGPKSVIDAVNQAAVSLLAVDTNAVRPGVVCTTCRWIGWTEISCPVCGGAVWSSSDLYDNAIRLVGDSGGTSEHISGEDYLQSREVAALIRFPVSHPV